MNGRGFKLDKVFERSADSFWCACYYCGKKVHFKKGSRPQSYRVGCVSGGGDGRVVLMCRDCYKK